MKFSSYHPILNFLFFISAIWFVISFNHPVMIAISFIAGLAYAIKLQGLKAFLLALALIPLSFLYAYWYSRYTHFGITVLRINFIGNSITVESMVYGLSLALRASSAALWMVCVFSIVTADKVIYILGKISPLLSLYLSITLRALPRVRDQFMKIAIARAGIGRGCRAKNVPSMIKNSISMVSILITWLLESFVEISLSMKNRGYGMKKRKAFSLYRFDYRDRTLVIFMSSLLTIIISGVLFNQTKIFYNPQIIFNRMTALSNVFYMAYSVFLITPLSLEVIGEARFKSLSSKARAVDPIWQSIRPAGEAVA